jgi:hypothetical protein
VVLKKTSKDLFLTANDISEITGMSAQYAYRLIKQLNEELKDQNFIVINGRVSKKYCWLIFNMLKLSRYVESFFSWKS